MSEPYKPELGQACFGQPHQRYAASNLLLAALEAVDQKLRRVQENRHQEEYESPFANTGNRFDCEVFSAHAYSWNDEVEQEFNFRWRDVRIGWYKYCGRGTSVNRSLTLAEVEQLLEECLHALTLFEGETDRLEREDDR